jgi:S1-C subfamily serine protease
MKKLLLILLLLISTSASAIDWRVVVIKVSDKSNIYVDYDSVYAKDNFLIFTNKSNTEGFANISPNTSFLTFQYAVSCTTPEYKSLSLSENYKNGQSKSIFNLSFSDSESLPIPNSSIIEVAKNRLCSDFSNLLQKNNAQPSHPIASKLLPKGINSVDWRFLVSDAENTQKFWVSTDFISNFGNGVVGFVAKFDYKTPQKLGSGSTYLYMIQYITLDCNKHTQDNISTEFFDKNENIVETYNKDSSEISMQAYEMKSYAGWAEVTVCPIANSKPVYQSSSDSNQSNKSDATYATGTGWQIGKYHLITANHVIENVDFIFVSVKGDDIREATVIASDSSNDLALIKVKTPLTTVPLVLATKQSKLGSKVAVIGYPLPDILGSKLQATSGEISGLTGLGNDIRFYQISAAVQSGNSGGPLLNQQGEVIGVISSKLNDANMLKERGELPQNVNFAVKSNYIHALIESAGIEQYKSTKKSVRIEDAIDNAKNSVYQIITSTNKK